ncbi:NUDIX domain-containing protein [Streptomyces umbrinus]|uniref:NUDIX domain-containing protein n=1 Tax=Streptomyces umbrinus TaxID=67370 RepID=UPI0027D78E71|nr:NUDIX domain-containing protein [Streptomyces umbrinus]
MITNEAGEVLMHLRDMKEGIWAPGTWTPMGGGAEPQDADPHATGERELYEEVGLHGIELTRMFSVDSDGYPVHVFHGRWDGDPASLVLTEGTALAFIDPTDMRGLPMSPLAQYAALSGLSADLEEQARADGIRDLVAAGIIVHDGAFLVVRRNPDDYLGGTWEIPAGQREKNESVLDSLLRAVVDETGLAVRSVDRYVGHVDYTNARGGTSRQYIFTITPEKPGPIALTEHDRHQWVRGTDDLPSTTSELRAFLDSREPLS